MLAIGGVDNGVYGRFRALEAPSRRTKRWPRKCRRPRRRTATATRRARRRSSKRPTGNIISIITAHPPFSSNGRRITRRPADKRRRLLNLRRAKRACARCCEFILLFWKCDKMKRSARFFCLQICFWHLLAIFFDLALYFAATFEVSAIKQWRALSKKIPKRPSTLSPTTTSSKSLIKRTINSSRTKRRKRR